jgi:hypothetical protein
MPTQKQKSAILFEIGSHSAAGRIAPWAALKGPLTGTSRAPDLYGRMAGLAAALGMS